MTLASSAAINLHIFIPVTFFLFARFGSLFYWRVLPSPSFLTLFIKLVLLRICTRHWVMLVCSCILRQDDLSVKAVWKSEHKDERTQNRYFSCYFIWVRMLVSHMEGKHAVTMFGKRMLWRIVWPKREDVAADWMKPHALYTCRKVWTWFMQLTIGMKGCREDNKGS